MIGKFIWYKLKGAIAEEWPYVIMVLSVISITTMMAGGLLQERMATLIGIIMLLPGIFIFVYITCYIIIWGWLKGMYSDYQKFKEAQSKSGEPE